jgi:hypothetical protein
VLPEPFPVGFGTARLKRRNTKLRGGQPIPQVMTTMQSLSGIRLSRSRTAASEWRSFSFHAASPVCTPAKSSDFSLAISPQIIGVAATKKNAKAAASPCHPLHTQKIAQRTANMRVKLQQCATFAARAMSIRLSPFARRAAIAVAAILTAVRWVYSPICANYLIVPHCIHQLIP